MKDSGWQHLPAVWRAEIAIVGPQTRATVSAKIFVTSASSNPARYSLLDEESHCTWQSSPLTDRASLFRTKSPTNEWSPLVWLQALTKVMFLSGLWCQLHKHLRSVMDGGSREPSRTLVPLSTKRISWRHRAVPCRVEGRQWGGAGSCCSGLASCARVARPRVLRGSHKLQTKIEY